MDTGIFHSFILLISLSIDFVSDLLQDEEGRCPKCSKHLEELESVKEEFERYKLRAQSVLKNKNSKVNRLRAQSELKNKKKT